MFFKKISGTELHLEFNEDEIKVLSKTKKLIIEDIHLKNFINELGLIVMDLQKKMSEENESLANTITTEHVNIDTLGSEK